MLTEVRSQIKITILSIKYAIMRELLNKATFISNVVFMILNNASFLIQWAVLYSIKDNFGGYTFNQVMLLWGIAAATYGFSHFFFKNAYKLSSAINTGSLDVFLVQPKSVYLQAITSNVEVSAIGDILFGYIMVFITGFTVKKFLLFTFFGIIGGISLTAFAIILGSLSFWFSKTDVIVDTGQSLAINFATYPDGIFKGFVKGILYIALPVGIVNYIPISIIYNFNIKLFLICIIYCILIVLASILVFNKGLKRYSSTNLMNVRT